MEDGVGSTMEEHLQESWWGSTGAERRQSYKYFDRKGRCAWCVRTGCRGDRRVGGQADQRTCTHRQARAGANAASCGAGQPLLPPRMLSQVTAYEAQPRPLACLRVVFGASNEWD